jgi:very-short-patch-repair endonuclease
MAHCLPGGVGDGTSTAFADGSGRRTVGTGCHAALMTRRPDFDHRLLAEMLRKQHDVVTRRQTVDCGMTDKALRYRIRRGGPWQRLLPGVYLAVTGTPTIDQRDMAGLLYAGPGRSLPRLRQVLAEVADGIRSSAEADLRDLVKRAGLPMPMFNARLYVGKAVIAVADAWWPEAAVAAEVDSREWHLSPGDWERTLRRHARLTAHGILVLHFTPKQIRTEPAQVVAAIRAALDAARADGQSRVRALPASA